MQKLTKEQAIVISAYTGIQCLASFGDLQEAISKKLNRNLYTHEFASPNLWQEIKDAYEDDFRAICYTSKTN